MRQKFGEDERSRVDRQFRSGHIFEPFPFIFVLFRFWIFFKESIKKNPTNCFAFLLIPRRFFEHGPVGTDAVDKRLLVIEELNFVDL